jgi:hypothetical protein
MELKPIRRAIGKWKRRTKIAWIKIIRQVRRA